MKIESRPPTAAAHIYDPQSSVHVELRSGIGELLNARPRVVFERAAIIGAGLAFGVAAIVVATIVVGTLIGLAQKAMGL